MISPFIKIIVIASIFFVGITHATVFKCTGEDGVIKYQARDCEANDDEKVMNNVSDNPEVVFYGDSDTQTKTHSLKSQNSTKLSKSELIKMKQKAHRAQCAPYLKQFSYMKRQVKERCKKDKDIYCDLPGDQIEEKNYERDLKFSYRDTPEQSIGGVRIYNNRAMSGKIRKPPLIKLKELLIKNKCI